MFLKHVANVFKKINIRYCEWINEHNIFYKMHVYGLKKTTSMSKMDGFLAYLNQLKLSHVGGQRELTHTLGIYVS